MSIHAERGFKREPVPAGNFPARCYKIIHYGTIPTSYMGESKMTNTIRVDFELPTEMRVFDEEKGEQPLSISKEYTLSMNEKANLCRDLESWRGKKFTDEEAVNFVQGLQEFVRVPVHVQHNPLCSPEEISDIIKGGIKS